MASHRQWIQPVAKWWQLYVFRHYCTAIGGSRNDVSERISRWRWWDVTGDSRKQLDFLLHFPMMLLFGSKLLRFACSSLLGHPILRWQYVRACVFNRVWLIFSKALKINYFWALLNWYHNHETSSPVFITLDRSRTAPTVRFLILCDLNSEDLTNFWFWQLPNNKPHPSIQCL